MKVSTFSQWGIARPLSGQLQLEGVRRQLPRRRVPRAAPSQGPRRGSQHW